MLNKMKCIFNIQLCDCSKENCKYCEEIKEKIQTIETLVKNDDSAVWVKLETTSLEFDLQYESDDDTPTINVTRIRFFKLEV